MAFMHKVLVLIVEDDVILANMYTQKLQTENYDVEVCYDGAEGFEKIKLDKPSVVVMDLLIPNMNGFEVLQTVKSDDKLKSTPIILLSNVAAPGEAQKAINAGASGYFVKAETKPSDIVNKVKELLAKLS